MTQRLIGVNRPASPIDVLASTTGPSSGCPRASELAPSPTTLASQHRTSRRRVRWAL